MSPGEIISHVVRVLGVRPKDVHVNRLMTSVLECSLSVHYDKLLELSKALGTTDINFDYARGEPGYSSWTPGTDSSFSFTIGIGYES